MARSKNGQAIGAARRTPEALAELDAFIEDAESRGALDEWRRGRAVRLYVQGGRRGAANLETAGGAAEADGWTGAEIVAVVEAGPQAAGLTSGMWTGRMVGALIEERYGVRYHPHNIPPLLHDLVFSV